MRLAHHVHVAAPPAAVWEIAGHPRRWRELDYGLARVEGAHGPAAPGQRLMATSRLFPLRIPVDVQVVSPERRLCLVIRAVPGMHAELELVLLREGRGTGILLKGRLLGPFARLCYVPASLWVVTVARMLAWRAGREHRAARSEVSGAA